MIFWLGLLDLIAGITSMIAFSLDTIINFATIILIMMLIKGAWSTYSGRNCAPIFILGIIDLIAAVTGLIFLNYGLLYSMAYLFAFLLLIKGFWTSFTTFFK